MTREEKTVVIAELKEKFEKSPFFYVADSTAMTVAQVNKLRRMCFERGVEMRVVKNSLAKRALSDAPAEKRYEDIFAALKGQSAFLFAENAKLPAVLLQDFRKAGDKPQLKGAYIDSSVYLGDDQLKTLTTLKSKEDLIGDIIMLLQSPMKKVVGAIQSGGATISGLVKTLADREEA
jgi:large subunit ribosomal protein L10